MEEGRWTTITPSQFQHEREALDHIRQLLPDTDAYRAWSNFTFTADTGHVREVDLLVVAPSGLYLIEVKSLHGRLTASGANWIQSGPSQGTRTFDNPLHLADIKAKQLKSLLQRVAGRHHLRVPFIQAAVFLSVPSLQVELPDHQLHWVYGPDGGDRLPSIWADLLRRPPADERRRVLPEVARGLGGLLSDVGIARSRRHYEVGSWELDPRPFDLGPTWQDHLARHKQLPTERRRVRVYLVERNAEQGMRASIEHAARREMLALHGISHPGIVQVDTMEPHEAGPALIFRHDPRSLRLDHFMVQYGRQLDIDARLDMIRQLAEAVSYAHGRQLRHRALSARSVLVTPARKGGEKGWLRPHLHLSDWQVATRGEDAAGTVIPVSEPSEPGRHLEAAAQVYLAPELSAPAPDPVALDVFGLGALSYLLLTGQPPADQRAELLARLAEENGLRPSAVADSATEFIDELVQAATAPVPAQRLSTVAEFIELLEVVEDEATAPDGRLGASGGPASEEERDLLEARPGDVFAEWEIVKRLGTGSTSRAFLAKNTLTDADEVLKVALSDEKVTRLEHEASVLRNLHRDSRVIGMARRELVRIGQRTALVLEHAGDRTLARQIRENGRLEVDPLEIYSDYLLGVLDFLEGEGVTHRDIKPDNIAIRIRPNRTRQLVLFDFSLAGISVQDLEAGTSGYLDPFLGTGRRTVYDAHAERYAAAVTLHQMASGELPIWGDGKTEPRYTEGPPKLAAEAFDPAVREGLAEFFNRALHRDIKQRFESLKDMRDAWFAVFRRSDSAPPVGSDHPEVVADDADLADLEEIRAAAALAAGRGTVLEAAGLTPRAISAAHRLGVATVGDLLDLGQRSFFNLPGIGAKTRQELQGRFREWRLRLGGTEPAPPADEERPSPPAQGDDGEPAYDSLGLDGVRQLLVPKLQKNRRNLTEVEATRLLLRLPDDSGELPDLPPWPQQPAIAAALGVTSGRVAQVLMKQRARWHDDPAVRSVRAELITLLADSGRVMGFTELADALLARRGSGDARPAVRRAIAVAVVRAAVEIDPLMDEPRLLMRRHGDRLLMALEVSEEESPDTPAAPALLDYADKLGKIADRLAALEVLATPATTLRELRAIPAEGIVLEDRRLVQLAAVAAENAAASPRLEIYPHDLPPVRALRLAQAGVVPIGWHPDGRPLGLTPDQVQEKLRARFPALPPLPGHPKLDALLAEAGFDLRWRTDDRGGNGRYVSPQSEQSSSGALLRRRSTRTGASAWAVTSPELADALRAEERLTASGSGGFRALTVHAALFPRALRELAERFGAAPLNVSALFMDALHEMVDARPRPTWETVLGADLAEPGSRAALKLGEYVGSAWRLAEPRLAAARTGTTPLLLHDAAVLARYDGMELLRGLATAARRGGTPVWVLCPAEDPARRPTLDRALTPAQLPNEWISLPDSWVANKHRSGAEAS